MEGTHRTQHRQDPSYPLSGYVSSMLDQTVADRLRLARERAGFDSPRAAARARGWNENTYKSHEGGLRGISLDAARRYARAFRVSPAWLYTGEGDVKPTVPLVGFVSVGGEIFPFDDEQAIGMDEVEAPPIYDPDTVGVRVGQGLFPAHHEGDIIYYKRQVTDPNRLIGRECVVKLTDGRMFVKILERGSKEGLFTLTSYNVPPLRDQAIEWAARVTWIYRAE